MARRDAVDAESAQVLADSGDRDTRIFRCVDRYTVKRPRYIHGHVALQDRAGHGHGISPIGDLGVESNG